MNTEYRRQGFTIVELAAVLIIVGILSAIAAPRFFNTSSFRSRYFYDTVLNSLRYAQKLAVYSGCHIQASTTSSTITLLRRSSCTTGTFTTAIRDPAGGGSSYVQTAPSGVNITASDSAIYFDSLGTCHRSSDATVANYTFTVGGKTINVIGQTGFSYDPTT